MSTTTVSAARFALDETRAAAWIADAIARTEGERPDQPGDSYLPEVGTDWSPIWDDDYGTSTSALVQAAQDAGVITAPEGAWVAFDFSRGDGEAGYSWLLYTAGEPGRPRLTLSDGYTSITSLGDSGSKGAEAALAILAEATGCANGLAADLDRYVAALPLAQRAPEVGQLLDRIKAAGWSGSDVVMILAEWFPEVGYPDDDEPVTSN